MTETRAECLCSARARRGAASPGPVEPYFLEHFREFGAVFRCECNSSQINISASCSVGSDIPKTASFGESYAQATYFKGYENSGFSNASNQFYTKAYDDSCASLSGGAKFFSMTGSEKTVLLEANRRTIIYALTNNIRGGGFAAGGGPVYDTSVCANKVAFVPKPFGKYDVIQRRKNAGPCELEIIDKDTGSPPASFERLEYKVCVK